MAHLAPVTYQIFYDSGGIALAGGSIYTYAAGTTTPQAAYTDETGGTPTTNPIVLDSNGGAQFWLSNVGYKFVIENSLGSTIRTIDNIYNIEPGSVGAQQIANGAVTPTQMNLSTLVAADLPNGLVTNPLIAAGAVTGGTGGSMASATIEASNIDPAIDLTSFDEMIECFFGNVGGQSTLNPLLPWSAPLQLGGVSGTGKVASLKFSPDGQFLAAGDASTNNISIFERAGTTFNSITAPDVTPGFTLGASVDWSQDGNYLAIGFQDVLVGGFLWYKRTGSKFNLLPPPATVPGEIVSGVAWNKDAEFLACSILHTGTSLYLYQRQRGAISYYQFTFSGSPTIVAGNVYTNSGNTFTTILAQAGILLCTGNGSPILPGGTLTLSSGSGSSTVTYTLAAWSAPADILNSITISATMPAGTANGCCWSPDGQYLIVTSSSTPFVQVYQRDDTTLSLLSSPVSLPPGACSACAISPDQSMLALGSSTSPYIALYSFSSGSLTALSAPSTTPAGTVNGLSWSPNGLYLAVSFTGSPYILVYERSGTTLTAIAAPSVLPTSNAYGIDWSPDGQFLAVGVGSTPYLYVYQTATPTFPSKGLLWVRGLTSV